MSACSTKTAVLLDDATSSVFVDDSSPSIVYSESWFPQGSGYNRPFSSDALPTGAQDPNYNHTVHLTSTNSETALFTFNGVSFVLDSRSCDLTFCRVWPPGIGVQVVGSVGPEPWGGLPVSRYTLDTLPTFVYRASADDSTFKTNVTFFESPLLADGPHALLITNEPCQNIPSSCKFMLDYIVWTNPNGSSSTSTTSSDPSATSTALCVVETDRGTASKHSRGMIIGPIIGGIILLVLFALLLLRFTGKRRQSRGVTVVDMIEDRYGMLLVLVRSCRPLILPHP